MSRDQGLFRARYLAATQGGETEDYLPDNWHEERHNDDGKPSDWGQKRKGNVVASWIYLDEHGQPYIRVNRTDSNPKQYPVERWTGSDWEWGAKDKTKIPYRLPQLIESGADDPVHIAEGEKCADALGRLGFVATTNSGGALKWHKDLNHWFAGKKTAFVHSDNDIDHPEHPGKKHAEIVARNLKAAGVQDVTVVSYENLAKEVIPGTNKKINDVADWIEAGAGAAQILAQCSEHGTKYNREVIEVKTGDIASAVDELQKAIVKAGLPVLNRGGILVEAQWNDEKTMIGTRVRRPYFRRFTIPSLSYIVTKHAALFKQYDKRSETLVPKDPPEKVLASLLEIGHYYFPKVTGIVNSPILRPDGSILEQKGHDPITEIWYEPDPNLMISVPAQPSKEDALSALVLLQELLSGYPFQSEVDRSVALAFILTTVARGAFDKSPMFLIKAHSACSGKSHLVEVVSLIMTGQHPGVAYQATQNEEFEKLIGALLLEGSPIISIDNCVRDLEGALLCQVVEQSKLKVRILGKSEAPLCEWRGVLAATGNNVRLKGDMTRRGLTCCIDPGVEMPELKRYAFDPRRKVLEERGLYISAALTVVRAYIQARQAGLSLDLEPLGSYEQWSKVIRESLVWLGLADPVKSIEENREDDPEREAAQELLTWWNDRIKKDHRAKEMRVRQIIELAEQPNGEAGRTNEWLKDYAEPDLRELLLSQAGSGNQISGVRLGRWFERLNGQIHCGFRLVKVKEDKSNGHRWGLQIVSSEEEE